MEGRRGVIGGWRWGCDDAWLILDGGLDRGMVFTIFTTAEGGFRPGLLCSRAGSSIFCAVDSVWVLLRCLKHEAFLDCPLAWFCEREFDYL